MTNEPLFTSRRSFLSGSLTFLSAAATMPVFLGRTASALAQQQPTSRRGNDGRRILVVVQLAGGNDGLNTVVPYEMDEYYKLRPRLAVPKKDVLRLKDGVGLHPAATGLKQLFDSGRMAIVQGVGYPNPNRSHFTSMDIWHTADPEQRTHEGWLGRYFDACCSGADPAPEPIQGVALMTEAPLAMQGDRFMPLAFEDPESLTWRAGRRDARAEEVYRKLNAGSATASEAGLAGYLQRAALQAQVGADEIRQALGRGLSRRRGAAGGLRQRGQLGDSLDRVARMIAADLPTRIYYVSMSGFDTHTGQEFRHRRLMEEFGNAMSDFIDTLDEHKLLDRVLVMSFSEFGRRVQENASGGTDHGEAAPMFLFGSKVRPGLHEKQPSLSNLHRGDLAFGCDFRRVYASVLRDWLEMDPRKILPPMQPLRLIAG
ncbi:MAG: DUF1501 domain-containing protein [Phycisphaerae bacterium]